MAEYAFDEKSGVGRIGGERLRQVLEKGWTVEHDRAEHADGSLLTFAALLVLGNVVGDRVLSIVYVGAPEWVQHAFEHAAEKYATDPARTLEIAGALIAAELDRISGAAS